MSFPRKLLLAVALILLCLAVLAATMPARAVTAWLMQKNAELSFENPSGTLWRGQAQQLRIRGVALGQLRWQISPMSLLGLSPAGHIALDGSQLTLDTDVQQLRDGSVKMSNFRAQMDASWLKPALGIPALTPTGQLKAQFALLEITQAGLPRRVIGELRWEDAGVRGLAQADLGGLLIQIASEPQLRGVISTLGANPPVQIDGFFALTGSAYEAEVKLRPNTDNKNILRALSYIGAPDDSSGAPPGSRHLLIQGQILLGASR